MAIHHRKAKLITEDNNHQLAEQFSRPTEELESFVGYYIVADFDSEFYEEILDKANLEIVYENDESITMKNDWFGVKTRV